MNIESYLAILLASVGMSFSHCIPMCGGIALGLNMRKFTASRLKQIAANIIYFLGRSVSYVCVGLAFSAISASAGFNNTIHALMLIALGVLLFIFSVGAAFVPKFLSVNVASFSGGRVFAWYKRTFKSMLAQSSFSSFFVIGVLNGLLPCHLVYIFALKAASTDSLVESFIIMLLFCAGSFLPLFLLGIFSASFLNSRLRNIFLKISFCIMCYFAFSNIYNGYTLLMAQDSNASQHSQHSNHGHH